VKELPNKLAPVEQRAPLLFLYALIAVVAACARPASFEGMVPTTFEISRKHPQSVSITVTGGQETEAVGRPQIRNADFAEALVESISKSKMFAKVIDGPSKGEDYLLTVTLFSMDKRVFGRTVKLEAGWTLRRAGDGTVVWQEAIVSEFTDFDVKLATEGAARNNIAQGLEKISKFNLSR
jgi:hypothetical protein